MRVVELPDHPGTDLPAVQDERLLASEQALGDYEAALARHRSATATVRTRRRESWRKRRWLAWLGEVLAEWGERRRAPRRPAFPGVTEQEKILTARLDDEHLVQDHLGRALGDEWVLFRGYRNSAGEIDHLLLGPRGLFALERSPRGQASVAPETLQGLLNDRGLPVEIERITLLTHPRSPLDSYESLAVLVATDMDYALTRLNDSRTLLSPPVLADVERLIPLTIPNG